jgi:hypothetical protein
MVRMLCNLSTAGHFKARKVGRATTLVPILLAAACCCAWGQQPDVHYYFRASAPPGAIGSWQLQRGGPVPGYFQPVEIRAPQGTSVSLAVDGRLEDPQDAPRKVGLAVGAVYRMSVTNIPRNSGLEVFPTIELIDRLYSPLGQEWRFAIQIELTQEDLELALAGKFVTRVIYVEDPQTATPAPEIGGTQTWFDVGPGRDPLAAADALGHPVAILRMGGRLPTADETSSMSFLYGCPPWLDYHPHPIVPPILPEKVPAPKKAQAVPPPPAAKAPQP